MPRHPSATAIREARSLLLKAMSYESEAKRKKRALPEPIVGDEEAMPLATGEGLKLLRQVARRVDWFLREQKDQADALLTVIRLRESGVLPEHLPVLPSARTLLRICTRGRVTSRKEAALVIRVLHNEELACYLGENAEALGKALDAWQWPKASTHKN